MKLNNKYIFIRHGQAVSNKDRILSCWPETFYNPLTSKGVKQAHASAKRLEKKNIHLIFSSDLTRTKQTAEIVDDRIGKRIKFDKRLREFGFGKFNGTFEREFDIIFPDVLDRFKKQTEGIESYKNIQERVLKFFTEINKKYSGRTILIVSHQVPLSLLLGKIRGLTNEQTFKYYFNEHEIQNAQIIELN